MGGRGEERPFFITREESNIEKFLLLRNCFNSCHYRLKIKALPSSRCLECEALDYDGVLYKAYNGVLYKALPGALGIWKPSTCVCLMQNVLSHWRVLVGSSFLGKPLVTVLLASNSSDNGCYVKAHNVIEGNLGMKGEANWEMKKKKMPLCEVVLWVMRIPCCSSCLV